MEETNRLALLAITRLDRKKSNNVPGNIRYFGSFNIIHPPSGDSAQADQAQASVQQPATLLHGSPLWSYSHLEALSAALVGLYMARLLLSPSQAEGSA